MTITIKYSSLRRRICIENIKPDLRYVLCVLLIIFVMFCMFRRTIINGKSMEPTLYHNQNYVVMRRDFVQVVHGDVVTAYCEDFMIVKRVIACPGDTLEITDGQVFLNGRLLDEPYIKEAMNSNYGCYLIMGEDEYFLMGDNRNNSGDSRHFGTFSSQDIFGVIYLEQQPLLWCAFLLTPAILFFLLIYLPEAKQIRKQKTPVAEPVAA